MLTRPSPAPGSGQGTIPIRYIGGGRLSMSKQERRDQLVQIVRQLPEATCEGEQHMAPAVRGKKFGHYLDDHHDDAVVGVAFKRRP